MPTLNGLSNRSTGFRPRPPSHGLRSESLTQGPPPTLTPRLRPGFIENLAHRYSPTGMPEPTRAIRPGTPAREEPEGVRRKARRGSQVKPRHQGPYPMEQYFTTALPHNSIIGADICLYSIVGVGQKHPYGRTPMPLGINSVMGTGIHRTR